MITGSVSEDGVPSISVNVASREWLAIIDTGFNGDVELPQALFGELNTQPAGRIRSALAGGQMIEEDAFLVEFPFDGQMLRVIATFVSEAQILFGTNLLRDYYLQIRFKSRTVRLERERPAEAS